MAIFNNLLGIFDRFHRNQPTGFFLFYRSNLLQNINKSYHKN